MRKSYFLLILIWLSIGDLYPQSKSDFTKKITNAKTSKEKNTLLLELADKYDLEGNDSCIVLGKQVLEWAKKNKSAIWELKADSKLGRYYLFKGDYWESQKYYEASLKLANLTNNAEERNNAYSNLGNTATNLGEYQKAIKYFNLSIEYDKKHKNYNGLTLNVNGLAVVYAITGNNKKAMEFHKEALEYAIKTKDSNHIALIYNDIGLANNALGHLNEALKYHQLALTIGEKIKKDAYLKAAYINLGTIYSQLKLYAKATDLYNKNLQLCIKTRDEYGEAKALSNLGFLYLDMEKIDSASIYFTKSLPLKIKLNNPRSIALTTHGMGHVYLKKKQYDKAKECYDKAYTIYQQTGDSAGLSAVNNYYGQLCLEKKDFKGAIKYLKQSVDISIKINFQEGIFNCYKDLSTAYRGLNDYKNAYDFHVKYFISKDSVLNEKISSQISEMDAIYQTSRKEKEIAVLNESAKVQKAVLERQEAEAKRRSAWIIAIGSGLLFVIILALILYRNNRQKKKTNDLLALQKTLVEAKNKDITDSINYARRIQQSQMPTEKYIEKTINRLIVKDKPHL